MKLKYLTIFIVSLFTALLLVACGSHTPPRAKTVQQRITTEPAPPASLPLETSRTPEGAKQALPPQRRGAMAASVEEHVSLKGLHLIEGFEGFGSCPYWDPYGRVWTRGYGETEGIGGNSPCIDRAYGEANLRSRLERFYEWALRGLHVALNQNRWDALASFVWNLGAGIFQGTSVGNYLRAGNWQAAAGSMLQYVHAGGQVLAGLVTRRQAEVKLFLTPTAGPSRAQVRATRLRTLLAAEKLRRALHNDIELHHCRPGDHAVPRRYHTVCGIWLREGKATIKIIDRYRQLLGFPPAH